MSWSLLFPLEDARAKDAKAVLLQRVALHEDPQRLADDLAALHGEAEAVGLLCLTQRDGCVDREGHGNVLGLRIDLFTVGGVEVHPGERAPCPRGTGGS